MSETYCAPTALPEADLSAPTVVPVASAANMAAPTGLIAVAPAAFPLPCEPVAPE